MSGVDLPDGTSVRKGAAAQVAAWVVENGGSEPADLTTSVEAISAPAAPRARRRPVRPGGAAQVLGVIHLKDVVKPGMTERFDQRGPWASAR